MKSNTITTVGLFILFTSVQSWVLPPGNFLSQFASRHDRASITVYLPTTDVSRKLIRNNEKSVTAILDESKIAQRQL